MFGILACSSFILGPSVQVHLSPRPSKTAETSHDKHLFTPVCLFVFLGAGRVGGAAAACFLTGRLGV